MNYKLPTNILTILEKRNHRSFIKKNIHITNLVLDLVSWTNDIDEAITAIKNNILTRPTCAICNTKLKFIKKNSAFTYNKGCCIKHAIEASNMIKYGVKNVFQLETTKQKAKKTCIKNCGHEYHNQSNIGKENRRKTNLLKYGVENVFQSSEIKDKIKSTMSKKYGVEHPMQSEEIKQKIVDNCIDKYGVTNVMFDSEIMKRSQIKNRFKRKEYKWGTGEISLVQGYEPIVLKELEDKGYNYVDVFTSPSDMPIIMYQFEEVEHRYYPDIFIPKDNVIIEVKSEYTLKKEWDKNQAKFAATIGIGFNFILEVR